MLHNGTKMIPYLKKSVRRNSASTVAQGKTVRLFFAPAEEGFAGASCGVQRLLEGLAGSRAQKAWRTGEPWGSGLHALRKRSEMGTSEDEPNALLEGRG